MNKIQDLFDKLNWDWDVEHSYGEDIGDGFVIDRVWRIRSKADFQVREQDHSLEDLIDCAISGGIITEEDVEELL